MTAWMGLAPGDGEDNVAEHVRVEREARGWSTGELARRVTEAGCAMSQSAVWRIESAEPRRKISVDELIAFSRVFGKPVEALLKSPRPDYPSELIQAYLLQWMKQKEKAWLQQLEATLAFDDMTEVIRVFPGAAAHLEQMLDEMLEAYHTTHLQVGMKRALKRLPQNVAGRATREPVLQDPVAVIAYWNLLGLSKEEMLTQAEEWGMGSIFQPIIERGSVHSRRVLGGRLAPLNRPMLGEHGEVVLRVPERPQSDPAAPTAGIAPYMTKEEQLEAAKKVARKLSEGSG